MLKVPPGTEGMASGVELVRKQSCFVAVYAFKTNNCRGLGMRTFNCFTTEG